MKENPKAVTVLVTTYYSTYLVRSDGLSGWANDCTQTTSGQKGKGSACCAVKTTTFLSINLSTTIYIYIYSRSVHSIKILKSEKYSRYPLFISFDTFFDIDSTHLFKLHLGQVIRVEFQSSLQSRHSASFLTSPYNKSS